MIVNLSICCFILAVLSEVKCDKPILRGTRHIFTRFFLLCSITKNSKCWINYLRYRSTTSSAIRQQKRKVHLLWWQESYQFFTVKWRLLWLRWRKWWARNVSLWEWKILLCERWIQSQYFTSCTSQRRYLRLLWWKRRVLQQRKVHQQLYRVGVGR